jgi:hypothetical protein
LQLEKIINDGKIKDHSWAVGMRTNITDETGTTDYRFRGVDIGGNKTRSITMWQIDPETYEYSSVDVYHSKARHSDEEKNSENTEFDQY